MKNYYFTQNEIPNGGFQENPKKKIQKNPKNQNS